jgi:cytochrome c553
MRSLVLCSTLLVPCLAFAQGAGAPPDGGTADAGTADAGVTAATGAIDVQALWAARCQNCHAADGSGKTRLGRKVKASNFTRPRWHERHSDEKIVNAIKNGVPKTKMKAFKDKLSEEEIQALAAHVRSFNPQKP